MVTGIVIVSVSIILGALLLAAYLISLHMAHGANSANHEHTGWWILLGVVVGLLMLRIGAVVEKRSMPPSALSDRESTSPLRRRLPTD